MSGDDRWHPRRTCSGWQQIAAARIDSVTP